MEHALEYAGWLGDSEGEELGPPARLMPREVAEAKEEQTAWDALLAKDQAAWKAEAEVEHMLRVEMVAWVIVEPVASKSKGDILTAIGRMAASVHFQGFEVARIHSDRGREYHNIMLRTWCAKHKIHKTCALAEEHQGNGRAEGAIMRLKATTRAILQQSKVEPSEWPMAAKLACHGLRNEAGRRLRMTPLPSIPFHSKVQVLQRSWNRGIWEALTITAWTRAPSADSSRGWVVCTASHYR